MLLLLLFEQILLLVEVGEEAEAKQFDEASAHRDKSQDQRQPVHRTLQVALVADVEEGKNDNQRDHPVAQPKKMTNEGVEAGQDRELEPQQNRRREVAQEHDDDEHTAVEQLPVGVLAKPAQDTDEEATRILEGDVQLGINVVKQEGPAPKQDGGLLLLVFEAEVAGS